MVNLVEHNFCRDMPTETDKTVVEEADHYQVIQSFGLAVPEESQELNSLRVERLDVKSEYANLIQQYFDCSNPSDINLQIVDMWEVLDGPRHQCFVDKGYQWVANRLLWHGTPRSNLISILKNSLRLPTQKGQDFGPGIYFADRMCVSAGYTDKNGPILMFLCQVALGTMFKVVGKQQFQEPPEGYHSIKALGINIPDKSYNKTINNWLVPIGSTVQRKRIGDRDEYLEHNEYIVFDQDRICIKFILNCKRSEI